MKTENVLLLAAAAGTAFYLWELTNNAPSSTDASGSTNASGSTSTDASSTPIIPLADIYASLICPSGTVIISDGTCCDSASVQPDGTCGSCAYGSTAAVDASNNPVCCPNANLSNGVCQTCPVGYVPSSDGSACVDPNGDTVPGFGLNFTTGNSIGDMVTNIGITIGSSMLMEKVGGTIKNALKPATPPEAPPEAPPSTTAADAAAEATEEAAAEAEAATEATAEASAEKAATEAAEDVAAEAAKKAAAKAAQEVAEKIATEVGAELAESLGEAAVEASTVVGIPLAVLDLLLMAVTMGLTYGLSLTPDSFAPDGDGDFGFSDLPDWANDILMGIPLIGSIISLLSPIVVIHTGCPPNSDNEGGLCYAQAQPSSDPNLSWDCHGFMCYQHNNSFEAAAESSTFADVTKKILVDTGVPLSSCPSGQVPSGALCYDDPGSNWNVVAGVAWQQCPSGFTDEGALCSNTTDVGVGTMPNRLGCSDFPDIVNCRDDGVSLWSDLKTSGGGCHGGGNCNTSWNSCAWRDVFGNCVGGVQTSCDPVTCDPITSSGSGSIVKQLADLQTCGDKEEIAGLCYDRCPAGAPRQPGGLLCGGTITKASKTLSPHPMQCPSDHPTELGGLCYGPVPDGFSRQVVGLISQNCPNGWADIGVACQRPTYTRAPTPGIAFRIRDRKAAQQDQAPKTCSELGLKDSATLDYCNSLLCLADEDIAAGAKGQDFCVSRCRDSYVPAANGMCVRPAGGKDSLTGGSFTADQYQRRNPFAITWNTGKTPPTKAESDWATFTAADATDVAAQDLQTLLAGSTTPNLIINSATGFGVSAYTGSQEFQGGDISGELFIQAQATLGNGDEVLLAQDGANVLVYDVSANVARTYAGDLGSFDPSSWAKYVASSLGFSLTSQISIPAGATLNLFNIATQKYLTICYGCPDNFGNPIPGTKSINANAQSLASDGSTSFTVEVVNQNQIALKNVLDRCYLGIIDSAGTVGSQEQSNPSAAATWNLVAVDSADSSVIGLQNAQSRTYLTVNSTTGRVDTSNSQAGNQLIASTWIVHY